MERGLITQALHAICLQEGKDVKDVQQYLLMKYRIEVEELVLKKRLEKLMNEGKAVA
ncbi:hypothetical protein JYB64_01880 [Algoriphagus aestuarii]|nr:hypothetical protein [Algoriphagus aestuarii]